MDKLLFLYNLHAGKGMLRGKLAPILDALTERWDVTVHPTRGPGDAAKQAHDRAGEFALCAPAATAPSTRWSAA